MMISLNKVVQNITKTGLKYWRKSEGRHYPKYYFLSKIRLHKQQSGETDDIFIDFRGNWPENEKNIFINEMRVLPNFLSVEEETQLLDEVEPYLKRLRYEFDHWDDAIHGYRETERKHWYPNNRKTIQKISNVAFNGQIMPYIHILDLDEKGVIKPHVDSARYCGDTIAGMSLLSNSVMRLIRTDEKKYQQNKFSENVDDSNYRDQPKPSIVNNFYADILLPRRSLYIMSHSARYNFTHEILANENSEFKGEKILKTRRISIICRNEP